MNENLVLPTFEDIFKPVKICFWLAGIPFVEKSSATTRFACFHIFIFFVDFEEFCYFLPKLESGDILEITSLIPCVVTGSIAFIKFTFLFTKRDKIIKITNTLSKLYENMRSDPNKSKVVQEDVIFLKNISKYYSVVNMTLLSVYVVKDIIWISYVNVMGNDSVYPLPFAIMLPLPIDTFPVWLFAYLQCSIGACICITYVVGSDVLYCVLTSHVCLNMSVISHQIENIEPGDISALRQTVEYHQDVLELSNDIEDIFTGPNFYNYLSASIQICVLVFNLSIADGKQLPQYILFLSSILLQIFLMSIFGEKLIRESERIGDSAYLSQWYNMDERMKKLLIVISERAKRSQKLTAYKLYVISYASFSRIISSSWSYFTILKTVYNPVDK